MKNFAKKNFPVAFKFLKKIWESSSIYKEKLERRKLIDKRNREIKIIEEYKIMKDVFENQYVVQNGHFKGMNYINRASGSALLPKIYGSYEEPIQDWIGEIINGVKYNHILDIGCAEGYYACGFAMNMPNATITAFDIDTEARKNANELKKINNLHNIEIKSECTHSNLNEMSKTGVLVFCDIEGFEEKLLDPTQVPNLKFVDLLIESHDCFVPNITEELISRFYTTHTIRIIVDYPYRVKNYYSKNKMTKKIYEYVIDEHRTKYMKFIYMESIYGKI
jgi:hypothetical protein